MVVDHDTGAESECYFEVPGIGRAMGLQADEGHKVSPDQYCSQSNGQIPATGIEAEQGPSLHGW